MALDFDVRHRLGEKQSLEIFSLADRSPGIYYAKLDMQGNSILSTMLVETADPGTTIDAGYYDFTTGFEIGEGNLIKTHTTLTGGLSTNKILVGNTHDKAFLKFTIAGGSARCSVYATIVSTTATELTDVLVEEDQIVNFLTDKAMSIAAYDELNGLWKFIRVNENGELVVNASTITIFENMFSANATIAQTVETTVISKTYTEATRVIKVICEGDGYGLFTWLVNDVPWGMARSSWNDRNVTFDLGAYEFGVTDTLKVKVKNTNYSSNNATYNIFFYEG